MNILSNSNILILTLCIIILILAFVCYKLKEKLSRYEADRPIIKFRDTHNKNYYHKLFNKYRNQISAVDAMSGTDFEILCGSIIQAQGFNNVYNTRASGDFGVDLIAEKDGLKYAIQCKCYAKPVGVSAVQEIYCGCKFYGCDVAVVISNQNYTEAADELARAVGVNLWGRKWMLEAIKIYIKDYNKRR